jgi:peptidoglycan/xylan/chitin deacetylase (PgdA/CDA1 family)
VFDTGYSFETVDEMFDHQYVSKPIEEIPGWDTVKVNMDYDPKASIKGKSLSTVDVNEKVIFLSFDDWGSDKNVTRILDTLDEYNVKASFFIIGSSAEKNPNLLRSIAEAGHDIGNHTYYHKVITKISPEELQEEVVKCHQALTGIIGREPDLYFRPPTLEYDEATINAVLATGFKYVLLSDISTQDYERSADEVVNYAVSNAENGGLIVMHLTDNSSGAEALPKIIEKLRAKGYKIAKLSDYLK